MRSRRSETSLLIQSGVRKTSDSSGVFFILAPILAFRTEFCSCAPKFAENWYWYTMKNMQGITWRIGKECYYHYMLISFKATLHNSRHTSCLHNIPSYRPNAPASLHKFGWSNQRFEASLKSSVIHKVLPVFFEQSDENSDCAICAPELCGVALDSYHPQQLPLFS